MSTIITRSGKGSALTFNEVDANFTNLNTDKLQSGNTAAALTITSATINGGSVLTSTLTDPIRHSVRPSLLLDFANTKQLDPRITFTRASTATFYDGRTTAKAEENLFTFSEQFDNAAWSKPFSTVTANATAAPDGTTTADLLLPNTTSNLHGVQFTVTTTGTTVISIYAKASGYDRLAFSSNNNNYIYFNLTSGTVESTAGTGWSSPTIVSVGNGWYRCIAVNSNNNARYDIFTYNALQSSGSVAPTFTGDGTSGVFLWGAQLEQRSSVTAYTPTTTVAITNYLPALQTAASGVPRFDHNPTTGESLGLLIEEQRVNLQTYSEQIDNAIWGKFRTNVVANTIVAPDGTLTGDKLIEDTTATNDHRVQSYPTISNATAYTGSIYAKAGELTSIEILVYRGATFGGATVNLTNGSVSAPLNGGVSSLASTTVVTSVGNGWYRISIPFTSDGTSGGLRVTLVKSNSVLYTGDGFSGTYIWGAQLEAGAFATSYIPTVASQVTRSNDAASMTGTNFSSWYRADEGTFFAGSNVQSIASTTSQNLISVYTSANDLMRLWKWSGASNAMRLTVLASGSNSVELPVTITAGNRNLYSFAYKRNDFAYDVNAGTIQADTTSNVANNLNSLFIGNQNFGEFLGGTISKIAYYPLRLTNAELIGLTTI